MPRALDRRPRALDVAGRGAREAGDDGAPALPGNLADRGEVALGRDGEARLNDVDAERLELGGDAQLFLEVHRAAGRLLPVTQGRVEDADVIGHGPCPVADANRVGPTRAAAPVERRVPRGE